MKKYIFETLLILIVCWCVIFIIDYIRCLNLSKPIFVVQIEEKSENVAQFRGLGYTVEVESLYNSNNGNNQIVSVTMKMFGKVIAASIT